MNWLDLGFWEFLSECEPRGSFSSLNRAIMCPSGSLDGSQPCGRGDSVDLGAGSTVAISGPDLSGGDPWLRFLTPRSLWMPAWPG